MTKLAKILIDKKMTQRDLQRAIKSKYEIFLGDDRISRMVSGKLTNYHIQTAKIIADTLEVSIDDIVEL
jgi:DNA-binding Xre family transcriptional regulator